MADALAGASLGFTRRDSIPADGANLMVSARGVRIPVEAAQPVLNVSVRRIDRWI